MKEQELRCLWKELNDFIGQENNNKRIFAQHIVRLFRVRVSLKQKKKKEAHIVNTLRVNVGEHMTPKYTLNTNK